MRASCSICQELFTSDKEISATPCGHVFHHDCVQPWVESQNNCPQCRKRVTMRTIIPKLFFVQTELEPSEFDSNRLKNELDDMRICVRDKDRRISNLETEQQKAQERVSALRQSMEKVQHIYKMELAKNSTLKKEVLCYKSQQEEANRAIQEAVNLREKLKHLQNLDMLRNGLMSDIEERAQNASKKDLAEWVIIHEKEMKRKRIEFRQLQENKEKTIKEYRGLKKAHELKCKDYAVLEEKLRISEEDLKRSEQQTTSMKKKLDALQKSIASPSGVGSSLAYRMIHESPAPMPPQKRPRLSEPGPEFDLDLNETGSDLFDSIDERDREVKSPSIEASTPNTQQKNECKEYGTRYIKISSASSGFKNENSKKEVTDISNIPAVSGFNILKRKQGSGLLQENNSSIRTGYNGLGGHHKFIQPKGFKKPKVPANKGLLTKTKKAMFMPPLPQMNL